MNIDLLQFADDLETRAEFKTRYPEGTRQEIQCCRENGKAVVYVSASQTKEEEPPEYRIKATPRDATGQDGEWLSLGTRDREKAEHLARRLAETLGRGGNYFDLRQGIQDAMRKPPPSRPMREAYAFLKGLSHAWHSAGPEDQEKISRNFRKSCSGHARTNHRLFENGHHTDLTSIDFTHSGMPEGTYAIWENDEGWKVYLDDPQNGTLMLPEPTEEFLDHAVRNAQFRT